MTNEEHPTYGKGIEPLLELQIHPGDRVDMSTSDEDIRRLIAARPYLPKWMHNVASTATGLSLLKEQHRSTRARFEQD